MSKYTQRAAAVALSLGLAVGFAGLAADAVAAPTPTATPSASKTATPTPSASAKQTGPATPNATTSPAASTTKPASTPKALIATEFRNDKGADGTMPQYERLSASDTQINSFGSLYTADGKPMPNRVVAVYDYTGGKRGAQLGAGVTDANGVFRFSAKLPSGWASNPNFNVQLAFDDESGQYESTSGVLTVRPNATAAPSTSATAAPTKDSKGGLAKTGA